MKEFWFGKVRVRFDAKQPCFELVCSFQVFLRYARAMYEFGVFLRLGVKQIIWKGFRSMELDLES